MKKVLYLDVEYANSKNKSICQLGLISEDFDSGEPILPELNLYINPNDKYDEHCIAIHHITNEITKDCKKFDELWPELEKYFVNSIIVGHNVKSSDLDAIVKNLQRYDIDIPELWCIDTYDLSRKLISSLDVPDYKLSTLCDYFGIDLDNEHDAFDDACACADLLKELVNVFGINLDKYVERYSVKEVHDFIKYASSIELRREINTLFGIINGIDIDTAIKPAETDFIINWRREHECYSEYKSVKHIIDVLDTILEDSIITLEELSYLKNVISSFLQDISTSRETRATQYLQGLIIGINADEKIEDAEILGLQRWLYENDFLQGHFPYDKLLKKIDDILEDGIITSEEKEELKNIFEEINNPIKALNESIVTFENKSFCLSGNFNYGAKSKVEEYICSKGGTIDKSVKKKTDYVVVGASGSDAYANGNYGTKVKKAMENGITVLKENQLFE